MSDKQLWLLAAGCWIGAWLATPVPVVLVGPVLFVGWFTERWAILALGASLLATTLGAHAWSQLTPVTPGSWSGTVTLANDPQPAPGGVGVDVVVDGHRVRARAWGSAAGALRHRLLGERVEVEGTLRPLTTLSPWLASRGITGSMTITAADGWDTGHLHHRLANSLRRTIESGAETLDRDQRALLTGFVYGDDRYQSPLTADAFRAAGLTHLLAVSGQNVAFVLVIVGPLLRRVDYRGRFVLTLAVLMLFATITRFEASVLRASVMASVAALATVAGRQASSGRVLAVAIAALVLIHPLIVHALAFQLSVAASAGILFLSPRLVPLVAGPRVWREAVAVTSGAQLAVAPLIVATFGGMPLASLPANLLAGPAAGPVMMWGLTAGTLAGGAGDPFATAIHVPTALLLDWVRGVAELATQLPLGELRLAHLIALGIAGGLRVLAVGTGRSAARRLATLVLVGALVAPGIGLAMLARSSFAIDDESWVWRDNEHTILMLDSSTGTGELLSALREHAVHGIDLVVALEGDRAAYSTIGYLERRHAIGSIWAPDGHRLPGASTIRAPTRLRLGLHVMTVVPGTDGLAVEGLRPIRLRSGE